MDCESLARLVEHLIRSGVNGLYVGGSTGEGLILNSEERVRVLETVVQAADHRIVIIAHIGGISTLESVRLARKAEQLGVDVISAVTPFYYKISVHDVLQHYLTIMRATRLPLIVYHYPAATGMHLSLKFYEDLAKDPQCIGVKFTSLNLFEMQQIRELCGPDFLIYNGHDEVYASGVMAGANGAIGSTFNIMPAVFTEMFSKACSGSWVGLPELQRNANEVIAHLTQYDVIAYEKYVCYLQGVIKSPKVRQPLSQLSDKEQHEIRDFYEGNPLLHHSLSRRAVE